MSSTPNYKYLRRKPGSNYKQLFVFDKGRYISARTLYGQHLTESCPRSAEELAVDFDVPMEAIVEAFAYCESDPPEIRADWEMEEAREKRTRGLTQAESA